MARIGVQARSYARALRARSRHLTGLGRFFFRQRVLGFTVPTEPEFDEAATAVFVDMLDRCRFYLEYGSGGSTLLAARADKRFISVDTDRWFLRSVRRAIGRLSPDQRLIHVDIGLTGPWGKPVREHARSAGRLRKWRSYAGTPWRIIAEDDAPDLVLVDGRFRVSTALLCCQKLHANPDARILVDDYVDRPDYAVIERHADLVGLAGRMAIFKPRPPEHGFHDVLARHATVWE